MLETLSKIGQKIANFTKTATPIDEVFLADRVYEETNHYFQKEMPYRLYDEENKLYIQENSIGFVLEISPLIGCNEFLEKELATLCSDIGSEGDSIQCLLLADHRTDTSLKMWAKPREDKGGLYAKIAEGKKKFFQNSLRSGECPPPRDFRVFFSYSSQRKNIKALLKKKERALAFFTRVSMAFDLSPQEFITAFSGIVNYNGKTDVNARIFNPFNFITNGLCLHGSINVEKDYVEFLQDGETNHFKAFEVLEYPDEWTLANNQHFLGDFFQQSKGVNTDFFVHYGIYFPKQGVTTTKLKTKQKALEQQLKFKAMRKLFSTAARESEEIQFVINEINDGQKFIQTHMTIGLFSKPEAMETAEESLKSMFSKLGFKIASCFSIHLDEFVRALPMTWGESEKQREMQFFRSWKTTTTHEAGVFLPLLAEWAGNSKTGVLMLGRRGQLLSWNPFNTVGNFNTVVVGTPGTGKSVFMEEVLNCHLGTSGRVFVIDLGRSFEKMVKMLKGQYLFFTSKSNLNLNPFSMIPEGMDKEDFLESLNMVASIVSTMASPSEKISQKVKNAIRKAVSKAFETKGRKATIDDVIKALKNSSYEIDENLGFIERLVDALDMYSTTGEYSHFFYGENSLEFSSNFVVIETEELKNMEDLQSVIMQIFSLLISKEVFMGGRDKSSIVCIDEAWDLLKSPQMEGFIESMSRRLRKYNGGLLVGTQSLDDFENSAGAAAAFKSSNWIVMLGNDSKAVEVLEKEKLEVTTHVKKCLKSLRMEKGKYSEAFIYNKATGFCSVVQLKLDPYSATLFSTSADNFKAIQDLERKGFSLGDAVEKISKQEM